jgi:flagellar hook assembly protein FlgD
VFTLEGPDAAPEPPVLTAAGRLLPNFPNPFNPRTQIRFALPAGSRAMAVSLTIHDIRGRRVKTLLAGELPAGSFQSREWDGCDESGRHLASGIYVARIQMGDASFSRKMVLLK